MSDDNETFRHQEDALVKAVAHLSAISERPAASSPALDACIRGELALVQGRYVEAAKAYREGVALEPKSPLCRAGYAYLALERKEAIPILDALVEEWPILETPRLLRGLVRVLSRDVDGAIEDLRESVSSRPDDPRAWLGLGRAALIAGDRETAVQAANRMAAIAPGSREWQRQAVLAMGAAHAYGLGWRPGRRAAKSLHGFRSWWLPWTFLFSSARERTRRVVGFAGTFMIVALFLLVVVETPSTPVLWSIATLDFAAAAFIILSELASDRPARRKSSRELVRFRRSIKRT
ncbi:MAG: tetratricopeptide repeat protein [Actinomycetota bacterium]|nr:tetratricopeptide repeat protein [Actinomycetota bacterium]